MKTKTILFGILFGVLCLIAATALALGFIHLTEFPYRVDMKALDICETSGLTYEVVLRNYRDAMRFLSPFHNAPFHLTDLAYSEDGAQHFVDTKGIFNALYLAGALCTVTIAVLLLSKRRKDKRFLRVSGVTTLALPLLIGLFAAIDFNSLFILFHKIFFNNDLWIFQPDIDQIITILPETFFLHCAVVIVVFWIIAAALQFFFAKPRQKK